MARSSARVSSVLLIHYPDASCRQYYAHSGVVWIDDSPRFLKKVGNLLSLEPNLQSPTRIYDSNVLARVLFGDFSVMLVGYIYSPAVIKPVYSTRGARDTPAATLWNPRPHIGGAPTVEFNSEKAPPPNPQLLALHASHTPPNVSTSWSGKRKKRTFSFLVDHSFVYSLMRLVSGGNRSRRESEPLDPPRIRSYHRRWWRISTYDCLPKNWAL